MSETMTMDAGSPGVVRQRGFKLLGFLPKEAQQMIGWLAKGSLAVFMHNYYDLAVLGHEMAFMPMVNPLEEGGIAKYKDYFSKEEVGKFYAAKFGGDMINRTLGIGGAGKDGPDSWAAYLGRKIVPGVMYCALFSAIYGNPVSAAASFIITTAMTDTVYKVVGEKLLGLPHIKS